MGGILPRTESVKVRRKRDGNFLATETTSSLRFIFPAPLLLSFRGNSAMKTNRHKINRPDELMVELASLSGFENWSTGICNNEHHGTHRTTLTGTEDYGILRTIQGPHVLVTERGSRFQTRAAHWYFALCGL